MKIGRILPFALGLLLVAALVGVMCRTMLPPLVPVSAPASVYRLPRSQDQRPVRQPYRPPTQFNRGYLFPGPATNSPAGQSMPPDPQPSPAS